ncbi:MAG: WYL domain-containing protein [Eubacterium sp.]|nr:WYL domain-containing protein [Eubacterium sp.]
MASSKTKTLLIFKYLNDYSDENNPLSTTDLIDLLMKDGMLCERKSIYADIAVLKSIGFDIVKTMSPKKGFFLATRNFELPEVRLLIDAVTSAGFITPNKTKKLVEKLETLVSKNQAEELVSQVYIDSDSKCDNEEIYYVIDALNDAIIDKKQVSFKYKRRNIDKENKKSYTEKSFTVSPYALIWKDDHYYLVCNNSKYDNLMNLRLDRMRKVAICDEDARAIEEVSEYKGAFDVADYSSKMFNMFSGVNSKVELLCDLDIREEIMDRFGAKIPLTAVDTDHFKTTIDAAVSDGLVSWIMTFGDKIKVVEPKSLAKEVKEKAQSIAKLYK